MSLVDRAKNILFTPKTEWSVIAAESTSTGTLLSGYIVPLAAVSALAGFIGSLVVGAALTRISLVSGQVSSAPSSERFFLSSSVVGTYVLSIIINLLAPSFGGQKNDVQAMKVAAYSLTAVWVAGLAQIIPFLGWLVVLFGGVYGIS